jgi:hypothetical protein
MNRPSALLVCAALLAVVGCDDGGTQARGVECADPVAVTSADDLIAELTALSWESHGNYTSGVLGITPNLVITGTVALNASSLPVPANCGERADCSPQAGLILSADVTGAVGEGDANLVCSESYGRVLLTDTTVRLRPYLQDTHPCTFNLTPMVEVLPACGSACTEGYRMCPADGVCYAAGTAYCQACEGGTKETCACRGPEGSLRNGASCTYWESGDVRCDGTCRDGACDAGPCP